MNFSVTVPEDEEELRNWLESVKKHCNTNEDFNDKVVSMLKTYFHLVQNVEWTVFDKSIEERWDHFEDKFQNNLVGLTDKLNQKIEVFQVQLQESVSKPIQNEFQKLQGSIDVFRGDTQISSRKGKIGEIQVERQIEAYFPDAEISDKSKQPHQTDYHLKLYGYTIFIEVKTYQNNAPQKEVDKFYRDLEENPDAQAGIMVSLTSGIANKPKFCYEVLPGTSKPIVFVPNANGMECTECNTVIWAILFTTLVLKYQESQSESNTVDVSLKDVMEMVKNQLQWVQLAIDSMDQLKELTKKHHISLTQQADRFNKDFHHRLQDTQKILESHVKTWTSYLDSGDKIVVPLPSMSQQKSGFKCNTCGKEYKVDRHYQKHLEKCRKSS